VKFYAWSFIKSRFFKWPEGSGLKPMQSMKLKTHLPF